MPIDQISVPNKAINWKKVIATAVAVLVVAGAIGAGIWWYVESLSSVTPSPTTKIATSSAKQATSSAKPDPTKDWKTYTTKKWGFSFKYPPNKACSKFMGATDQIENSLLEVYFMEKDCQTRLFEIAFSVIPKNFNFLSNLFAEAGEAIKYTDSTVTINGVKGTQRAYKYSEDLERKGQNGVVIQLTGEKYRYLISTVLRKDLKKPFTDAELELMISSFKILD